MSVSGSSMRTSHDGEVCTMAPLRRRGDYDADLQQFYWPGKVNIQSLAFLRWAVARGRLSGDGPSHHAAMMLDASTCEEENTRCGICPHCRATEP
jgi:hypothetical protein